MILQYFIIEQLHIYLITDVIIAVEKKKGKMIECIYGKYLPFVALETYGPETHYEHYIGYKRWRL